ncbi:MAG TPA: hypothetical protein PK156_34420 [Polyangium sp.]|nr:hypothetical protein [Polyangium sp.]
MQRFQLGVLGLAVAGIVMGGCGKDAAPQAEPVTKEAVAPNKAAENTVSKPAVAEAAPTDHADPVKPASSAAEPLATAAALSPKSTTTAVQAPSEAAANPTPSAAAPIASEIAPPVIAATSAAPEAPPPPPVESPKQAGQAFSVWIQSSGRYTAGQQGTVEAVVIPKAEFHCNADYPYKFVTSAGSSGVTYPKPTVRGDGLSVSTARAVMRIPFVPQNPGDAKVGGTFHFSVCSESQCVVEKRDVFVTVKVQ